MRRRDLIALGTAATGFGLALDSLAQAGKIPAVGWLGSGFGADPLFNAFRAGLATLGYVEGRSIRVDGRSGHEGGELRALARELVQQQVGVIVASGRGATRAAQEATANIPIVMAPVDDPYEFVASLSRPGGNITGLALQQTDIDAKQIEILKEIVPALSRLAIFYYYGETYYALESTAQVLGAQVIWIEVKSASDLERAFGDALEKQANGLLIVDTGALGTTCNAIAQTALARRLPTAASWRGDADAGLLLSFAADDRDLQHRAASYVDRLLNGAVAGELPIEQATKFELAVNLKTAEALGIKVPPSVLLRANQVVE